jgi:sugar phosphate isomerase/epimerase
MVIREAGRLGVQPNECFLLNFGWPINSPDAERRQRTHELFPGVCRFASAIGCKSILVIPGPVLTDQSKERSLELSAGALQNLAAIAGDFSLHLNAEADIDSCASTPEAAEELCKRVPGLGLTLDYSHFVCQGIEPARIERLHRFTRHLHVRQAAPGQIATEIDDGVIDFSAVLRQLESTGYSGLYCVEYLALTPGEDAGCCAEQRTLDARYQLEHYFREGSNEN